MHVGNRLVLKMSLHLVMRDLKYKAEDINYMQESEGFRHSLGSLGMRFLEIPGHPHKDTQAQGFNELE